MVNKNRFTKKVFAAFMAAVIAAGAVGPGVFASETPSEDPSSAATTIEAQAAPEEEAEDTAAEEAETVTETEAPASGTETGQEEETGTEERKEEQKEEQTEQIGSGDETQTEKETEKETKANDEKPSEEKTQEEKPGQADPAADNEETGKEEETEIRKSRVSFRFDEGAGIVKVIISSDDGASKDDPSLILDKEEGKDAEADFRSDYVKSLAADDGSVTDNTVSLDLEEGTYFTVVAEAADGYAAAEYSISEDDRNLLDFDPSEKEFSHEFSVDDKAMLFEAKTVKEAEAEAKEDEIKFGLILDSAGGKVTVDVKDKDGNVTSYEASMDKDGKITVSGDGKGDENYALLLNAKEEAVVTVTAVADENFPISIFTVTSPDGKEDTIDQNGIINKLTGLFAKENKVTKTFELTKGLTTAKVSFMDSEEFEAEQKVGRVIVKVKAEKGVFPTGTTFKAVDIFDEDHLDVIASALISDDVYPKAAVDITFYDKDGKEIQPNGMVQVTFEDYNDSFVDYTDETVVVHVSDEGNVEEIESEKTDNVVTMENDKFSPYVLLGYNGDKDNVPSPSSDKGSFTGKESVPTSVTFGNSTYHDYTYHESTSTENDYWEIVLGHTTTLSVTDSNGNKGTAVCVDPYMNGAEKWANKTKSHVEKVTSANILKALYYGQYDTSKIDSITGNSSNRDKWALVHYALSYYTKANGLITDSDFVNGEKVYSSSQGRDLAPYEAFWVFTSERLRRDVASYMSYVESAPVPSGYTAYIVYPTGDKSPHGDQSYVYLVKDQKVSVTLKKTSANTAVTNGNSCYSLAGAVFGVYSDAACKNQVGTLTTKADGTTNTLSDLATGTYYAKELKAPKGYALNTAVQQVAATNSGNTYTFNVKDVPKGDPVAINIEKNNASADTLDPDDILPLDGAVFKISFYKAALGQSDFNADGSAKSASVDRTWYIVTKKVGDKYTTRLSQNYLDTTKSNSEFYTFDGQPGFPLGTFVITEESAPVGYESNGKFGSDSFMIGQVVWNETTEKAETNIIQGAFKVQEDELVVSVAETPKETEIGTTVKDNASGTQMVYAGEPVKVTLTDTINYENLYPGKEYTANGKVVDKESAAAIAAANPGISEKELFEQAEALKDADGNPVTGTQTFTADASGKGSVDVTITFKVDPSYLSKTYVVFENVVPETGTPLFHADVNDRPQTFVTPNIGTTASEARFDNENGTSTIRITDTISFEKLEADKTYTAVGTIIDKETGEALLVDGNPVTAEKEFTPEGEIDAEGDISGTVDVEFEFDGKGLDGKAFVVFEEVYVNGKLIASHKDLEDEKQSVELPQPEGQTKATDVQTGNNLAADNEDEMVNITDDFMFKNLIPGTTYTMKARIVRKDNQEEVASTITGLRSDECEFVSAPETGEGNEAGEGAEITEGGQDEENTFSAEDGTFFFIPRKTDGVIHIDLTFNKSDLRGADVVVFEKVTRDDADIIIHEDVNDENQTIHVPNGETEAKDQITGTQSAKAEGTRILEDALTYKNLIPGETYSVIGTVMLQPYTDEDGNIVEAAPLEGAQMVDKDGNAIEAHTFVASEKDGVETLYFQIDASKLAGRTLVVFETVRYNGVDVIIHADINDEPQKVYFPDGETKATDARTESHTSLASEDAVINDEITYRNLIPGKTYTAEGTLYDKATQKPLIVDGKPVVSEPMSFVPSDPNGSVTVTFKFDSSALQGKTLVAFEKVLIEGKEVFVHEDIEDKEQTVYIPKIGTTATDKADGDHTLATSGRVTVEDKVTYTNLDPEKTYKVEGVLVDKASGKRVGVDGKVIINTVTFKPDKSEGSIVVPLTFNVTNVKSGEYVVFEKVYEIDEKTGKESLVGSHEDINDTAQTVRVPNRPTTPGRRVQTGDVPVLPIAAAAAVLLALAGVYVATRKKK